MSIRDSVVKCDKIKNNNNELVFIGCPLVIHNNKIKNKKNIKYFWIHIYAKRYIALLSFVGFNYNSISKVFNHHHGVYTIN